MRLLTLLTLIAASLAAVPLGAQLTVRLTVPAGTPPDAVPHIAGSFNRWDPGAAPLTRTADGTWTLTLPSSVRGPVEFKFALGAWDRVETTAGGADVGNRAHTIPADGADTLAATVAAWRTPGAAPTTRASSATRSVRVVADRLAVPQLGRTRRVWVYLPPGYATSARRYPVLYMHDGQNVFDAATSGFGEWGVDESLDSLSALGDRGAIVVAVDHGGSHRLDEYDPWKNPDPALGGGEGKQYVDFLVGTLKPWIDRRYRTLGDRAHTSVAGSSMGGLISLYAALARPEVFGSAGVLSCACWIARDSVLALARAADRRTPRPRLYFVVGDQEAADGGPVRDQGAVVETLVAAGYRVGTTVQASVHAGRHDEAFWRREFPAAYAWLVGGQR